MDNCEHKYKLENTQLQYATIGDASTGYMAEYAYLMCEKCFKVIKKEVKLDQ